MKIETCFRHACSVVSLVAAATAALSACDGVGNGRSGGGSLGCLTGRFELRVRPTLTSAGELLKLSTNGPGSSSITHDSWGTFGRVRQGRFEALYDVSAAVGSHGPISHPGVIRITDQPQPLAGVGLPDHPFLIRVPKVSSGRYLVEFYYSVNGLTRAERLRFGIGPRKGYHLCAYIRVLN
jgi:hypothetical protein